MRSPWRGVSAEERGPETELVGSLLENRGEVSSREWKELSGNQRCKMQVLRVSWEGQEEKTSVPSALRSGDCPWDGQHEAGGREYGRENSSPRNCREGDVLFCGGLFFDLFFNCLLMTL